MKIGNIKGPASAEWWKWKKEQEQHSKQKKEEKETNYETVYAQIFNSMEEPEKIRIALHDLEQQRINLETAIYYLRKRLEELKE